MKMICCERLVVLNCLSTTCTMCVLAVPAAPPTGTGGLGTILFISINLFLLVTVRSSDDSIVFVTSFVVSPLTRQRDKPLN